MNAEYFEWEADLINYENLEPNVFRLERRRTEILMDLLDLSCAKSLLDVGCGDGMQLEWIHWEYSRLNLMGVDISRTRIDRARGRVCANFRVASAENIGSWDERYDRILCSEVLEHTQNPKIILGNIYTLLEDNGLFVVSVPYDEKLVEFQCTKCGEMTTGGHINSFNESKLKSALEDVGFKVMSVRGYGMAVVPFIDTFLSCSWWMWFQNMFLKYSNRVEPYYLIAVARKCP